MDYIIKCEPLVISVSPFGFYKYAEDFFKAGEFIKKKTDGKFSPVPYFLFCRSIELIFNSFLLGKNIKKESLKRDYGHDLEKLLSRIEEELKIKLLNDQEKMF